MARWHEQANLLALNFTHDIVIGTRDVGGARDYYATDFADYRRKQPTPYVHGLRFSPISA